MNQRHWFPILAPTARALKRGREFQTLAAHVALTSFTGLVTLVHVGSRGPSPAQLSSLQLPPGRALGAGEEHGNEGGGCHWRRPLNDAVAVGWGDGGQQERPGNHKLAFQMSKPHRSLSNGKLYSQTTQHTALCCFCPKIPLVSVGDGLACTMLVLRELLGN